MMMTMMMLIDETVAVGLLSCYLEVKYSMSIFTSAMFLNPPPGSYNDVYQAPDASAALRVVTQLLSLSLHNGGG